MADTPEAVIFAEAVRRITEQRQRLENVRSRAGLLLSAAAVVTSFLGSEALKDPAGTNTFEAGQQTLECAELVAVLAFVGVCATCLCVLLPKRKGWTFGFRPAKLVQKYVGQPPSGDNRDELRRIHRDLALWLGKYHDANERPLEFRFTLLQVGAGLLAVEVVAWIVDLT